MRLRSLLPSLVLAALAAVSMPALAAYPDKPIRLIVPSAPGGAPDALMRALGTQLSQQMGVPVVIDNKPGGSYTIGTMDLVRSAPDGYTLAYGNVVSLATNKSLLSNVPYDVEKDLTLIANTLRLSNLMIVNNDLPVKSVPELIAYAKKNPDKLAFASDGNGTTAHLGVELFKSMTGTSMLHVPYKAATAAMTDLIGGGVQLMMINTPVSGPQAQSGRVRALGISSSQALVHLPGHSHHRRSRRAGLRGDGLGRHRRTGPHAQGRRHPPQCRDPHRAGQPGGARALQGAGCRDRPQHAGAVPRALAPRDGQVGQDRQGIGREDRLNGRG